jgi:hypothetical protein
MLAAAGSVTPKTRKGRTATVRPSTNLLIISVLADSIRTAQVQRLATLCGITGRRAELIASFVWGPCDE